MASLVTTPPPHRDRDIQTPPTPKHGYEDAWEPYPVRKSARLSSRNSANHTPSPRTSPHNNSDAHHFRVTRSSPQANKSDISSAMSSPARSPQKKRLSANNAPRRHSSLTAESTANAANILGLSSSGSTSGMLPTPAKTPARKDTSAQNHLNIQSFARNLFAPDETAMPKSRSKQGKKYVLDSFANDEEDDAVQIFTDSHERVPEIDRSAENPFWGEQHPVPEPAKRRSRRNQQTVNVPGEGEQKLDDVVGREDGMVYVFRGKRKFYKRTPANMDDEGEDEAIEGAEGIDADLRRPLTRSSIKPRLLFPPKKDPIAHAEEDEEEAVTDIEEGNLMQSEDHDEIERPQTPVPEKAAPTPKAPKYAPVSPPSTARATRSGLKTEEEATPMKPTRAKKRSPFDGWPRTKRQGDSLESEAKRSRTVT